MQTTKRNTYRQADVKIDSRSTPAMDQWLAQLHQGISDLLCENRVLSLENLRLDIVSLCYLADDIPYIGRSFEALQFYSLIG